MAENYYDILGISKSADKDEIKKAYRKMARKYHPDVNPGDSTAEDKFKKVSEAYGVLSDEEQRKQYDRLGHDAFKNGGHGYDFSNSNYEDIKDTFGGFGFEDIFGQMFGGAGGRRNTRQAKGEDLYYTIRVPFYDVINGNEYEINVNHTVNCPSCGGKGGEKRTCPQCQGAGQVSGGRGGLFGMGSVCPQCGGKGEMTVKQCNDCGGQGAKQKSERIKVKIPKGVDKNSKIRIPGKGNAGANGGPQGDLFIVTNVVDHPLYSREGNNLYADVPVNIFEAMLGAKITVPTPYGNVNLNIPAGTQPGQKFRLKGRGVPKLKKDDKGDLYIVAKITVPQVAVEEDRKALSDMMGKYSTAEREKTIKQGKI